jgi:hypothetical protein
LVDICYKYELKDEMKNLLALPSNANVYEISSSSVESCSETTPLIEVIMKEENFDVMGSKRKSSICDREYFILLTYASCARPTINDFCLNYIDDASR